MVCVVAVADEVARTLRAETVRDLAPDVVLAAGDLPWDYLEELGDKAGAPVVYVPGNHDPAGAGPRGALAADGRVIDAGGLRIAGLGGCVRYREGPHQYTQRQYAERARRLVRAAKQGGQPVDVLLTHAPPLDLGDDDDLPHQGVAALHDVLAKLRPTWHLHGHVHPYGRTMPDRRVGTTMLRNVIPWVLLDVEPRVDGDQTSVSR